MTSAQQILIFASLVLFEAISMGLIYWIGRQTGRATQHVLEEEVLLLRRDLREARESILSMHSRLRTCVADDNGGSRA